MKLQSLKSKVVNGFAQLSGLVLMGVTFAVVIGSPYSDQIRQTAFWLGVALVTGLAVYAFYHVATSSKTIFNVVLSQAHRLAKIPGDLIRVVNSCSPHNWSPETSKAYSLRLPPDIFFAREMGE
jgi:hypothetical protein